jgi:hypothetical protein
MRLGLGYSTTCRVGGVRSSELGINPTYGNKVKNRRARVSDALLERMLRMLSVDEFAF